MPGPTSGLKGFEHAERELMKSTDRARRAVMIQLARRCGVQGGAAFTHVGRLLRYYAGEAQAPIAPARLTTGEAEYISLRVREALAAYDGDPRFPRMRKLRTGRVAA